MKIAIDGTAASGKGTLSEHLSKELKLPSLDTGLLYRDWLKIVSVLWMVLGLLNFLKLTSQAFSQADQRPLLLHLCSSLDRILPSHQPFDLV